MSRGFHLVVVPAGGVTFHVALSRPVTTIGSSPEADVRLPDPDIAAVHARIEVQGTGTGHVLVREQLPLLVNGLRSKAYLLAENDLIVLGKNALSYRRGPPPAPLTGGADAADAVSYTHLTLPTN